MTAIKIALTIGDVHMHTVEDNALRLQTIRTWGDNWDGEGGPAPNIKAVDEALALSPLLSAVLPRVPSVAVDAHGHIMFMIVDPKFEVSITIRGDDGDDSFLVQNLNGHTSGEVEDWSLFLTTLRKTFLPHMTLN